MNIITVIVHSAQELNASLCLNVFCVWLRIEAAAVAGAVKFSCIKTDDSDSCYQICTLHLAFNENIYDILMISLFFHRPGIDSAFYFIFARAV